MDGLFEQLETSGVECHMGNHYTGGIALRGRSCKPDNRTVISNGIELQSVQDAVHLGHRVSTINKDSLVADAIATFWRGYNMFMGDFGHTKTAVKCKLSKQYSCSYYGTPL